MIRTLLCLTLLTCGGSASAQTDTLTIQSKYLGAARQAFVALPASHANTQRAYPVVFVLDGEYNFTDATAVTKTLSGLGHFPESIVVAIPNASEDPSDRVHDMTPPGLSVSGSSLNEGGDQFLDFIEKELLPLVKQRYRGGAPAMLVGHSSGGIIVTYAAATRANVFPVIVSIDAPIHLGDNWLANKLNAAARAPNAPPLRYVSLEARFGWSDSTWQALAAAAPKNWHLRREHLDGESHETMGFLGTYQGLKFAFADYSVVGAPLVPRGTALDAFAHYRKLEEELRTTMPPPARALERMVDDLLTVRQIEPARRAYGWLVEGYGPRRDQARLLARIEEISKRPPLEDTVEQLRATPYPTPAQIAPYVGEWRGHSWMNEHEKYDETLRIRVVDGKVVAETTGWGPPGQYQTVQYLKVLPNGFEYGNMNGMRPMGMIVRTLEVKGTSAVGTSQFRGIVLPLPNGHMPEVIHVQLERAR